MNLDTPPASSTEPSREAVLAQIDFELAALSKTRRDDGWTSQALQVSFVAVVGFISQSLATSSGVAWNDVLARVLLLHLVWDTAGGLSLAVNPTPTAGLGSGPRMRGISFGFLNGTRLQGVCTIAEMLVLIPLTFWFAPRAMGWSLTALVAARYFGVVGLMLFMIGLTFLPSLRTHPHAPPAPEEVQSPWEKRTLRAFDVLLYGVPLVVTLSATGWLVRYYPLANPATPIAAGLVICSYLLIRIAANEPSRPEVLRLRWLRRDLAFGRASVAQSIKKADDILAGEPDDEEIASQVELVAATLRPLIRELEQAARDIEERLKHKPRSTAQVSADLALLIQRVDSAIAIAEARMAPSKGLSRLRDEFELRRVPVREGWADWLARSKAARGRLVALTEHAPTRPTSGGPLSSSSVERRQAT